MSLWGQSLSELLAAEISRGKVRNQDRQIGIFAMQDREVAFHKFASAGVECTSVDLWKCGSTETKIEDFDVAKQSSVSASEKPGCKADIQIIARESIQTISAATTIIRNATPVSFLRNASLIFEHAPTAARATGTGLMAAPK